VRLHGSDSFVLIAVERDRIYAVTSKSWIIASCFGIITISQFILGLYVTAYGGCESVIKRPPQLLPLHYFSITGPTDPTSDLYDVRLRGTTVFSNLVSRHVCRIRCGTSLVVHRSSGRHALTISQTFWPSRSSFISWYGPT